jgi:hypothetical protein
MKRMLERNHFKREVEIDQKTGRLNPVYFYKGKRCKSEVVQGPLASQYIGYRLIAEDLREVEAWLKQAYALVPKIKSQPENGEDYYSISSTQKDENILIIKSLFFSSIIFYGKCFTDAKKGRRIKLERKHVPKNFLEVHDEIMRYRHNLAAHSGEGRWDTGELICIFEDEPEVPEGIRFFTELYRLNFKNDQEEEHNFLALVQTVLKWVNQKFAILQQKINSSPMTIEKVTNTDLSS